jgi:hypothetical protein
MRILKNALGRLGAPNTTGNSSKSVAHQTA